MKAAEISALAVSPLTGFVNFIRYHEKNFGIAHSTVYYHRSDVVHQENLSFINLPTKHVQLFISNLVNENWLENETDKAGNIFITITHQ